MSTSNTLTKNDLKKVLEKLSISTGGEGALNDMIAQEIEEFLSEIEADGPNLVDYVVEQGTSGIWTYRKWNSGIAECWGTIQTTSASANSTYGTATVAYKYCEVNFPTSLFITTPIAIVSAQDKGGGCATGAIEVITNLKIKAYSSGTETSIGEVYCEAKGRWK